MQKEIQKYLLYIFFIIVVFSSISQAADDSKSGARNSSSSSLNPSQNGTLKKDQNGNIINDKTLYQISREKEYLSCLKPNAIKGIDTVYLKDKKGRVAYTVEIWGSKGECEWERDKLLFKKGTPVDDVAAIVSVYKTYVYLHSTVHLLFKVTNHIPNANVGMDEITIPYFILVNDKMHNNKFIFKKDLSITVKLPKEGSLFYDGEDVTIGEISFPNSNYLSIEMLSGIYFDTVNKLKKKRKTKKAKI